MKAVLLVVLSVPNELNISNSIRSENKQMKTLALFLLPVKL